MPITIYRLLSKPLATFHVAIQISSRILYSLSRRCFYLFLTPFHNKLFPTTLRTELVAATLGPLFAWHHTLIYTKPDWIDERRYSTIEGESNEFLAYVLPAGELNRAETDVIFLFAHGGGYAVGDGLMYIKSFERWIKQAEKRGFKLKIVSVEYPLSTQAPYPACLNSFNSTYAYLLGKGFNETNIVFGGDSAGGGLVTMSSLSLSQLELPQPSGTILISPWLDLSISSPHVANSPNKYTDWLIVFDTDAPKLASILAGDIAIHDPRLSPLLISPDSPLLKSLPRQLITAGKAEILLPDSMTWGKLVRAHGVEVIEYYPEGQIHTFSMGFPLVPAGGEVERKSDKLIIEFIELAL